MKKITFKKIKSGNYGPTSWKTGANFTKAPNTYGVFANGEQVATITTYLGFWCLFEATTVVGEEATLKAAKARAEKRYQ